MLSAILLSAGASVRFGSPKALAEINGLPAISYVQNTLLASSVNEIIVVLGCHSEKIKPYILNHTKIKIVHNKDYNLGQTSSLQAGLKASSDDTEGFMVFVVDTPLIKARTVDALAEIFTRQRPKILIPTFRGRKGHPPVFSASFKPSLLSLDPQTGLNAFERSHASDIMLCAVEDEGILKSFNTPEEFRSF